MTHPQPHNDGTRAFYEDFGQRLRQARGPRSQAEVGAAVGLSRGSISNIEAGRQHIPLHVLSLLAKAVGVEPAALIPDEAHEDVEIAGLGPQERMFVAAVAARLPSGGSSGKA